MKFISKITITLIFLVSAMSVAAMKKEENNNMKFGMQVVMTAQEGKGEELANLMVQASELVSTMAGCKVYIVQVAANDADKILITEVWDSQEDQQASLANQEVRALISDAKPMIAGMEHILAKPLGGKGL